MFTALKNFWRSNKEEQPQFQDKLIVSHDGGAARWVPPASSAYVEVLDANNKLIHFELLYLGTSAPPGSWRWNSVPSTFVVVPTPMGERRQQEIRLPFALRPKPFSLPAHISDKPGAAWLDIWWSCE